MGGMLWKSILGLTNPKTENRRNESWRNSVISSNVFEVHLMCIVLIRTQYLIVNISVVLITLAMSCLCWEFNTELRVNSAHLNRQLQKKIYIVSGLKYWLRTRCCSFFDILTGKKTLLQQERKKSIWREMTSAFRVIRPYPEERKQTRRDSISSFCHVTSSHCSFFILNLDQVDPEMRRQIQLLHAIMHLKSLEAVVLSV